MKTKIIGFVIIVALALIVPRFYKNPPDKLLLAKYPNAKNISWTTTPWGSSASFKIDSTEYSASFNKHNIWEETSTKINKEDLPKRTHLSHRIIVQWVDKVENAKGETEYRVHALPTKSYTESLYVLDSKGHKISPNYR